MTTDRPLGVALIALGVGGIITTMQITALTFNDDPGPKLFPMIACSILLLCGLGMIFVGKPGDADARKGPRWRMSESLRRGITISGLLVAYSVGLWLTGYYVATPIAVFALYWIIAGRGRQSIWRGAVYALLVTAVIHFVFAYLLNSYMPHGMLF